MKFNMDIKTLIFIISTACIGAGFYYTTQARLDAAENEISYLNGQIRALKAQDKHLLRMIRKNMKKEKNK